MTATGVSASPDGRRRASDGPAFASRPVGLRRQRERAWIILGVFLVVACSLLFALISLQGSRMVGVLAMRRSVGVGDVLSASDLKTVRVAAGSGFATVPASSAAGIIGRPAAVPLAAGALLTPDAVGAQRSLPEGHVIVGLALKAGQFPLGLAEGDHVRVVDTASAISGDAPNAPPAPVRGVVVAVASAVADDGSVVVSLQVVDADADAIAALGGDGHASVVVEAAGS